MFYVIPGVEKYIYMYIFVQFCTLQNVGTLNIIFTNLLAEFSPVEPGHDFQQFPLKRISSLRYIVVFDLLI